MPLTISQDGAIVSNQVTQSGAPGVRIAGANVTFTNTDSGRALSTSAGSAGLILDGVGATVTNELGGIISGATDVWGFPIGPAIQGSAGADTIYNYGLVAGNVSLGGGNDSFTQAGSHNYSDVMDLGTGDDLFVYDSATMQVQAVIGGDGIDTLRLWGERGVYYAAANTTGMEVLDIGRDVMNLVGFSGFTAITLQEGGRNNLVDCFNPDADVIVRGGLNYWGDDTAWLAINLDSAVRSITGTDGKEAVEVAGTVSGDVLLGGGDDSFTFQSQSASTLPVAGAIDGGDGTDIFYVSKFFGTGDYALDLSATDNFETLHLQNHTAEPRLYQISGADDFDLIHVESRVSLLLLDSDAPDTVMKLVGLSAAELGAGTTLGSIETSYFGEPIETVVQGHLAFSTSVVSAGAVLGDIRFAIGDDSYDGRLGSVGGTVFGYAGNDTFLGGAGIDRFSGGFGGDLLAGGLGADILDGGGGFDTVSYAGDAGAVFVNLATGQGFGNAAQGDSYAGIEHGIGTDDGDFFIGSAVANHFDAGAGDDTLLGGLGADVLTGGGGVDTASYEDNQGAVFVNLTTGQGFGNAAQGDTYSGIENLKGGIFADFFIGDEAVNRLDGADGNDTLIGALGADVIAGGNGTDTASYEENWGGVFVNLTLGQGFGNAAQGDTYEGIENLKGGIFDDFFIGDAGANSLAGALGADTLVGAGGADSFLFDTALGGGNIDTINDFTAVDDTILLDDAVFAGLGLGALSAGAFVTGPFAGDADDRVVYNQITGALFFDADGNGAGAAVQFATLQGSPTITASDFMVI